MELDAALFHLYGVSRADVEYVMDTFPVVKREDEAAHGGAHRTKELVLDTYDRMNEARAAGDAYRTVLDPPPGKGPRYPDAEQAELLLRTFGCVRYVWNKALAERVRRYKDEGRSTSYVETAAHLMEAGRGIGVLVRGVQRPAPADAPRSAGGVQQLEDLTVRNMPENHSLARAISDASWSELRSMLEYKCQWYGRELLLVDRWFPSSKLCSTKGCSHRNTKMPLNVRSWTCPSCGTHHDRDVNAARNILAAGPAER